MLAQVLNLATTDQYHADPDPCECSIPYFNLGNPCAYCGTGSHDRGTPKDDFFKKCSDNNITVSYVFLIYSFILTNFTQSAVSWQCNSNISNTTMGYNGYTIQW